VARIGGSRNAYVVLVRQPEGKRPHGRFGSRWEDKRPTKMDLKEMWSGVEERGLGSSDSGKAQATLHKMWEMSDLKNDAASS